MSTRSIFKLSFAFVVTIFSVSPTLSETIGGGSISSPAIGPPPSIAVSGGGFTLVKNWHFGTNGTIKNISDLNANFQYHDQFGTYHNPNYGALIVAPDAANALPGQPIGGGPDTGGRSVRQFFNNWMRTFLVPLNGATTLVPAQLNTGSGSFQAQWTLPNGGSFLGQDIIWETRVRYVTPPYFYLGLWTSGNIWNNGAEYDLIESFGYKNGPYNGVYYTNYNGQYWHSDSVGGVDNVNYGSWPAAMASVGITNYNASVWHTWDWVYYQNNTYAAYVDGIQVQSGTLIWTVGGTPDGEPINMSFIFDGTWGSPTVSNDDYSLPASALTGTYYDWEYSRVYLR
jgi:hypothetical protein